MRDPMESTENQYLNEMYGDEETDDADDTVEIDRSYIAKAERAAAGAMELIHTYNQSQVAATKQQTKKGNK